MPLIGGPVLYVFLGNFRPKEASKRVCSTRKLGDELPETYRHRWKRIQSRRLSRSLHLKQKRLAHRSLEEIRALP